MAALQLFDATVSPDMTCLQPATRWEDALPCGNGEVGALVYGHVAQEKVLFNHEHLWFRTPKPDVPDVHEHLPDLRALLAAEKYKEAQNFLSDRMTEQGFPPYKINPYHPAFDLACDHAPVEQLRHYRRALYFSTGEAEVTWECQEHRFARRVFVSRVDDMAVFAFRTDATGQLCANIRLDPHATTPQGMGYRAANKEEIPITFNENITRADGNLLRLVGRYEDGSEFGGMARVITRGGTCTTWETDIRIDNADEILVLVKFFANEAAACALPRLEKELNALPGDYAALLARHRTEHEAIYNRMALDLHARDDTAAPNDTLLLQAFDGHTPTALVERMARYGRYLLLSSSRAGGWPANLQGVWNGSYAPAWSSDFHNDENIQMNYWQALPGNMPEVTLPYFEYYDSFLEDSRRNAQALFGCRGIFIALAQSTHGCTVGDCWPNWTGAAGWLAQLHYDYWLFTGDETFLRERALPFLREVALFYEDFLIEGEDGTLLFSPSLSPENAPILRDGQPGSLCSLNATMDIAIAREVFGNLIAAYTHLGDSNDDIRRWQELLGKLPAYEINADGALREWLYPGLDDNYHHRHQSHLYPLFPGFEFSEEETPQLVEAVRVAVEKRLVIGLASQTGWSLAHMANIYARLGEGDRALDCLHLLLQSCTGPNLFTYHNDWRAQGSTLFWGHGVQPPFQIDANLGFTAAVQEMLLFSRPGMVALCPALPTAWTTGAVDGLRCRGGISVSLDWNQTERTLQATLRSPLAQTVLLKCPGTIVSIDTDDESILSPATQGERYRTLALPANRDITLHLRLDSLQSGERT